MNAAVPDPICAVARRRPDAAAVITPKRTVSYAALNRAVDATAARLRAVGVQSGDRVAWCRPRAASTIVLFGALLRLGAVAAPVSTREPPEGVADRLRRVRAVRCVTDDNAVAEVAQSVGIAVQSTGDVLRSGPSGTLEADPIPLDRPATIIFTSGSTGAPKAALHTWGNHYFSAAGSSANIPIGPGDRWLLSLPLYHVGGLAIVVRCWLGGAAVVIPAADQSISDACVAHRITHVSLVATQLRRMLERGDEEVGASLKAILVGGGPVPFALPCRVHARGWPVHTTYGCTEMASQVTTTRPGADLGALRTSGQVLPHRELRIADTGAIWVRGDTLCRGYVEGDAIRDPRNDTGWYATGDVGHLDDQGRLHVTGRLDHQFISGGENIQPEEIEQALRRVEGVERAIVVPVPDDEFGERPVAFVDTTTGGPPAEQLRHALERTLPRFKIPDRFYPWPDEAGTGEMKIDRAWFRRQVGRKREE